MITIGVNGETLDECESVEESMVAFWILRWSGRHVWKSWLDTLKMQVYCRVPVAEIGSHKVIKTRWVDTNKGTSGLHKFVAGWWRKR